MNLEQLEHQVDITCRRDDLQGHYKTYINEAVHDATQRWNWACMAQAVELTMEQGESAIKLPCDFKELQSRNVSPVMIRNTDTTSTVSYYPVRIMTESEIRRINSKNTGFSTVPTLPVWIDREDDSWFLFIDAKAAEPLHFRVKHYRYLPTLEDPTDENGLTREYPRMIYSRARQLVFESVDDPASGRHELIYESEFKGNKGHDAMRRYHGRDLRM